MSEREVIAAGVAWRFLPEAPPPTIAERTQAMLQARLIDEVLGTPVEAPLAVSTDVLGAVARQTGGGRVGLVGRPALAFFTPMIALSGLRLAIEAPGFLPLALESAVGPQPGYPDSFAAVDLGDVALHRAPTRLSGRVVSRTTGPMAGAAVRVTGLWPQLQHPPGPVVAPNLLPAFAGLYADRPIGGTVRRRNLVPGAPGKRLLRPAVPGDTVLRLSDRLGIAAGKILALEGGDPERGEFIGIAAIDTGSSADQPAEVTLDFGLRRTHLEGAAAARAVPGSAGPLNALTRAARSGDVTLFTAALAGIGPATAVIEVTGGPAPAEFHATALYRATTTAEGDFALPSIHRVAALELTVTPAGPPPPLQRIVALAWNLPDQREDVLFA